MMNREGPMNVLAVVAHPDDEVLSCGATLRRLPEEDHRVSSVVLCAGADTRGSRQNVQHLAHVRGAPMEIEIAEASMLVRDLTA